MTRCTTQSNTCVYTYLMSASRAVSAWLRLYGIVYVEPRLETERLQEQRSKDKTEAEAAALRLSEISRASIAQMESKMAAAASSHALELERSRKELMNERSVTQEIVTEAKQEAAAAMAQTLEAREDALRWQRAFNAANTPSSPTAASNYKALRNSSP